MQYRPTCGQTALRKRLALKPGKPDVDCWYCQNYTDHCDSNVTLDDRNSFEVMCRECLRKYSKILPHRDGN